MRGTLWRLCIGVREGITPVDKRLAMRALAGGAGRSIFADGAVANRFIGVRGISTGVREAMLCERVARAGETVEDNTVFGLDPRGNRLLVIARPTLTRAAKSEKDVATGDRLSWLAEAKEVQLASPLAEGCAGAAPSQDGKGTAGRPNAKWKARRAPMEVVCLPPIL